MVLPTKWTLASRMPSRARLSPALRSVVNIRSASWSVINAVDLLGHAAITAPKASFHMGHGDAELRRAERGREGGIHVSNDHDKIRAFRQEYRLQPLQYLCGLGRVRA